MHLSAPPTIACTTTTCFCKTVLSACSRCKQASRSLRRQVELLGFFHFGERGEASGLVSCPVRSFTFVRIFRDLVGCRFTPFSYLSGIGSHSAHSEHVTGFVSLSSGCGAGQERGEYHDEERSRPGARFSIVLSRRVGVLLRRGSGWEPVHRAGRCRAHEASCFEVICGHVFEHTSAIARRSEKWCFDLVFCNKNNIFSPSLSHSLSLSMA